MTQDAERTHAYPADPVGFFTVLKLVGVILLVLIPCLGIQAMVFKGFVNSIVEEKMQQFAVAKIEYDVRRADTDRFLARLETTDVQVAQRLQDLDARLRQLDSDLKLIKERQDQVRAKLHLNGGP